MMDPQPSATIVDGRYQVVNRLGSGGMADVYCAEDLQLGRKVALKLLHRRFAEDEEFVERFRREASSAAGLQHPNVVAVYDRGEWDGTYYIAMEYLEGRSLKRVVEEEAPLEPARAVDLVSQVLKAARFAHKRGIIHRDLKPHNVIVDADGRAKVTDFGIARAGASDMTQTGSIMGTAQYLSPEQAQGHGVSAASDLYSIGVVLYELLTGRVPFEGESAVTIALKHVNEDPEPPSRLNPVVTPELDAAVLRALEKDPGRRFADADEFLVALEHARRGLPGTQHTAATAMATGVGAGLGAAAGPPPTDATQVLHGQASGPLPALPYEETAYAITRPAGPPPPPPPDDDGRRWWVALLVGLLVAGAIVAALALLGGDKVTVPDVVGADQASAELALKNKGLSTDVTPRRSEEPEGTVIGQSPPAGAELDEGDTVTLTVSSGPGEATVPDLRNKGRRAARRALSDLGFEVREEEQPDDEIRKDRVISTRPEAGASLQRGSEVTLVVSTGPEQVEVPRVVGLGDDEARRVLEDAGFSVTIREQETDDAKQVGRVLGQEPDAGTQAAEGSGVAITVGREAERAEVPDIEGETQNDATERLSSAGFAVRVVEQEVDSPEGDGVVLEQDPAGGSEARRGSRVTITVGKFEPDLNPEPDAGEGEGTQTTP